MSRLCETGVAGWKIPLIALLTDRDEVAKSDESKTAYQLLEPHWESLGFVCGEPTVDEITAYKAGSGTLADDAKIIEHLKIKNIYGMIKIYIDQNQLTPAAVQLWAVRQMLLPFPTRIPRNQGVRCKC